ncbi:MAG: serine hydrolase [Colwellia sp.]|nr:serine hydrolase [Colwellia sp.]
MKLFLLFISMFAGIHNAIAGHDFTAIDRYVNAVKKEVGLPSGTAIAIVKDGQIIYEGYFGYANIKEQKKVTDKTAFYIASVTKPLFALSTLLMENNGDINDNTTMSEMFPQLNFPYIDKNKVQVKHLLSHSHALANRPLEDTLAFTGQHNKSQRLKLATSTTINQTTQLGDFQYSNLGYNLFSIWAEDRFKQDWQKTIDDLVYQPLAMKHTSSYISDADKRGFEIAQPYGLDVDDPKEILPFVKSDITMQAAGGAVASARDMAKFLIAQLNEGRVDGKQVFPAKVIEKSHQQLAGYDAKWKDFKRDGYAWGWYIGPYKEEQMLHHFGGTAGTHAHASFMLEHNIGLVVLNNEEIIGSRMTNAIADIAYSILLEKGDGNAIVDTHIKSMDKNWQAIQGYIEENVASHQKRNASRVMKLTQAKVNYTGVFHNPLWGDLKVELLKTDEFKFTLGELYAVATAATLPDEFRIQFQIDSGRIASYNLVGGKLSEIDIIGINPLGIEKFTRIQ